MVGHPDLDGKIVGTYNAATGGTSVVDEIGHGTMVASMAAAETDNGIGRRGQRVGRLDPRREGRRLRPGDHQRGAGRRHRLGRRPRCGRDQPQSRQPDQRPSGVRSRGARRRGRRGRGRCGGQQRHEREVLPGGPLRCALRRCDDGRRRLEGRLQPVRQLGRCRSARREHRGGQRELRGRARLRRGRRHVVRLAARRRHRRSGPQLAARTWTRPASARRSPRRRRRRATASPVAWSTPTQRSGTHSSCPDRSSSRRPRAPRCPARSRCRRCSREAWSPTTSRLGSSVAGLSSSRRSTPTPGSATLDLATFGSDGPETLRLVLCRVTLCSPTGTDRALDVENDAPTLTSPTRRGSDRVRLRR